MKILRCDLLAFGAFRDASYTFESGVNLFEGLNEAGKTTLLHFIEGMLYGFFKPTGRTRRTESTYERYVRSDGAYRGAMLLEHDQKVYRLERDFKAHTLKVFLDATGQDITDTLPTHPVWRQADLGTWLDMPYGFFVNAMRMTQTHLVPNDAASDFIAARLQNLDATGSETLSVTKALEYLNNKIKAIKNKGKTIAPLKEVEEKLATVNTTIAQAHQLSDRLQTTDSEIQALQAKRAQIKEALDEAHTTMTTLKQRDANRLFHEISPLFERHLTLEHTTLLSQLIAFSKTFDTAQRDTLSHTIQTFEQAKETLSMLEASQEEGVILDEQTFKQEEKAIFQWALLEKNIEEKKTSLQALQLEQKAQTLASYETELKALVEPVKPTKPRLFQWFLIVPIIRYLKAKKVYNQAQTQHQATHDLITRRLSEASRLFDEAKTQATTFEASIEDLTQQLEKVRHQYGFSDLQSNRAMERLHQRKKDSERTLRRQQQQRTLQETLENAERTLQPLTAWFTSTTHIHDIKHCLKTLEHLERRVKSVLPVWFESLNLELETDLTITLEDQHTHLETLKQNDEKTQRELAHLQGTHQALEAQLPSLAVLYGEQDALQSELEALNQTLETLERAKQKLEDAAQRNEDNFAPKMALHMSEVLKTLTLGHYDTLKIRRSLAFKVKGHEGDLKEASHFSTGTQDQVVLAIRLGLLKTLEKDHYPLFFDDVFAYFDGPRLQETLNYLATLKASQIFIFTAHTREKQHLDAAKIPYHIIQRTD